jgi:hypothetical protein
VKLRTIAVLAPYSHPVDLDLAHVILIDDAHELSDVHLLIFLAVPGTFHDFPEQQGRNPDD